MIQYFLLCLLVFVPRSFSHEFLLATNDGVKTLSIPSGKLTTLHSEEATAVDYRYSSRDIYFISNSTNEIMYSYYSLYSQGLASPVTRVTLHTPLAGLAVDWVSYKLYYGSPLAGSILQETLSPSTPRKLVSQRFPLQNLALDPYSRILFFTMNGDLYSIALGENIVSPHMVQTAGLTGVTKLAVDTHHNEVYLACQRQNGQGVLAVKDYSDEAIPWVLYEGNELQNVRALAVYQRMVFWISFCEEDLCMFSCERDTCSKGNFPAVWITNEEVNDLKVYSPLAQTPDLQAACQLCSHGCAPGGAYCTCPDDMHLADNVTSCIENPPTWSQKMKNYLVEFYDTVAQWLMVCLVAARPYPKECWGLAVSLVICGVFLLTTIPCFKVNIEDEVEDLPLGEMHHPQCLLLRQNR